MLSTRKADKPEEIFWEKSIFHCTGFMVGSKSATAMQVSELHSSILGKSIQKTQPEGSQFLRKMHHGASNGQRLLPLLKPRPLLPPRSASSPVLLGVLVAKGSSSTWVALPSFRKAVRSFQIWSLVGRMTAEALQKFVFFSLVVAASCKRACGE